MLMMKWRVMDRLEKNFADWENSTFGYGYGSGEEHVLGVLHRFLECTPESGPYDFEVLERELNSPVAWLLINALCRVNILEYGTSPRFAWLTKQGRALRQFVLARSTDTLCELIFRDEAQDVCYPDACNCGPNGYEPGRKCDNPFWNES